MSLFHRFSLSALMLTTLAASAMSVAVAPQPADAFFIRREDADVFNNKYASKHYIRGKCSIARRRIFVPVPMLVEAFSFPATVKRVPVAGRVRCSADVFKRKSAVIRQRRTRTLHMKSYVVFEINGKPISSSSTQSRTCNGKRCVLKYAPIPKNNVVGMTACIESRGKSRIVQIGTVPKGLDNGFKSKRCSQRKF